MKKIISVLAAVSLTVTTVGSVVACGTQDKVLIDANSKNTLASN